MQPSHTMTVSELKNKLLEVVRRVEKGEVFEITKDGAPVAVLAPRDHWTRRATGFARITIKGELELPPGDWTYDIENLKPTARRRRK
jgi:prevent-host-death family protein